MVAWLFVLFQPSPAQAAEAFTVIDADGRPACSVSVRTETVPPVETARKLLVDTIAACTGATLPGADTGRDADAPAIVLALDPDAPKPETPRQRVRDGFTVNIDEKEIRILGANAPSIIYGVCSFLEKYLGVRWLAPGELWTVMPKHDGALTVPAGQYSETAAFDIRCLHTVGVQTIGDKRYAHWHFDAADWMMHTRMNRKVEHVGRFKLVDLMDERGIKPLRTGHAMRMWMPNDLFFADHPDYYAYDGMHRRKIAAGGTQLNYANEEMSEVFARRVIDYLETGHPDADRFGITLNDGYGFSIDPLSKRNWFYDENGMPIVSDNVFGFTNRVAAIVASVHPEVIITQLAYTPYYHRPPRFPIHPNVGIRFCMYRGSAINPMCEATNDQDRKMRWELEEWRKTTDQVVIAEYLTTYWADAMFASGVKMIAKDIQWYKQMGFPGACTEYQAHRARAREMMYVYNRMLWNSEQDYMDIVRDFYQSAYGRGAAKMFAAYDEYWNAAQACGYHGVGTHLAVALSKVDGFIGTMRTLLETALDQAREEKQKVRIRHVRQEFDDWMKRAEPFAPYRFPFREPTPENLHVDNLAPNPSFEDEPAGWRFSSESAEVRGAHLTTDAWEGERALAIVSPDNHPVAARAQWSMSVPVEKGEVYRVEIMVKPDRQAIDSMGILYLHTSGTDHRRGKAGPPLMIGQWRPLGLGVVKATSDSIGITMRLYRGAGTWLFDGLRIQKLEKE